MLFVFPWSRNRTRAFVRCLPALLRNRYARANSIILFATRRADAQNLVKQYAFYMKRALVGTFFFPTVTSRLAKKEPSRRCQPTKPLAGSEPCDRALDEGARPACALRRTRYSSKSVATP